MSAVWAGRTVAVVGAAGRMGAYALRQLQLARDKPARLLAIDRQIDAATLQMLRQHGVEVRIADAASGALGRALGGVDLVLNFAGPYYRLGAAVLEAALEVRCDYVDVCDDADAVQSMLALDTAARSAGIRALIGAGSAPGVTNLLAGLALDSLGKGDVAVPASLLIGWVTSIDDLSPGVFDHVIHCLRSPLPRGGVPHAFAELKPRVVQFPDPIGALETILFPHPEPITFRYFRDVEAELRGAVIPPEFMQVAWSIAGAASASAHRGAAHAVLHSDLGRASRSAVSPWGGALHIEAWLDGRGVRIQTLSDESMEETTVTPCLAFARLVLAGRTPRRGVLSPEVLSPADFFSTDLPKGRGRTLVERLRHDQPSERISLRTLLSASSDSKHG